jgi:hypothetical protein
MEAAAARHGAGPRMQVFTGKEVHRGVVAKRERVTPT